MANRVVRSKGKRFTHKLEAYVEENMRDQIQQFEEAQHFDSTAQAIRALLQAGLQAKLLGSSDQKSDDKTD